jgi:hypothetical protein
MTTGIRQRRCHSRKHKTVDAALSGTGEGRRSSSLPSNLGND